jgi:uncharacterized protein (TIGR02466 family)
VLTLWSTPVGEYSWPGSGEKNAELRREILALYEARGVSGQGRSYPEFTHHFERTSYAGIDIRGALGDDLWAFLCAAVADYLQSVQGSRYSIEQRHFSALWPNVSQRGEFHRPHRHNPIEHIVVGTYYVAVPPDGGGREGSLSLMDPRGSIGGTSAYRRFYSEGEICLQPTPGYLVLFPPHVYHYVAPHTSAQARISISFNVTIDALATSPTSGLAPAASAPAKD